MPTDTDVILIQDSREQNGYGPLFKSPFVIQGLETGDYSVLGLEDRIAVERKSLPDLLGSLTKGRKRFEQELKRARAYHRFFVVVEASQATLLDGDYQDISLVNPLSIWETIAAFSVRYGIPFLACQNRRIGAALTESLLTKYARESTRGVDTMRRAVRRLERSPVVQAIEI